MTKINEGATRKAIYDVLQADWENGLTRDEIIALVTIPEGENPNRAVGVSLGYMQRDGLVKERNGRFYLATVNGKQDKSPETTPKTVSEAALVGTRIQLTDMVKNRPGASVALYQSPVELEGIVKIQMLINGVWFSLPYAPAIRICTGPGIPQWSDEQETTRGITRIRLVKRDGSAVEQDVSASSPITIDYIQE